MVFIIRENIWNIILIICHNYFARKFSRGSWLLVFFIQQPSIGPKLHLDFYIAVNGKMYLAPHYQEAMLNSCILVHLASWSKKSCLLITVQPKVKSSQER